MNTSSNTTVFLLLNIYTLHVLDFNQPSLGVFNIYIYIYISLFIKEIMREYSVLAFCLNTKKQECGHAWPHWQSGESRVICK
jgi:hypothetical protein